jgi:hypothetical protein
MPEQKGSLDLSQKKTKAALGSETKKEEASRFPI